MPTFMNHMMARCLAIGTVTFLSACTTCTTRYRYDTSIEEGGAMRIGSVAIVLKEYAKCEVSPEQTCSFDSLLTTDGWRRNTTAEKEGELVAMVSSAIGKTNRTVTIVPLKTGDGASPGPNNTPPSYLIRLSAYTAAKKTKTEYDAEAGVVGIFPVVGWTATNNTRLRSHCIAELIGTSSTENAGKIDVESTGVSATTYSFLFILPLPPIPTVARTEKTACERLGELVGMVLEGDDLKKIPVEAMRK